MFAYAAGSNFDSNAKQWRLFADIMNDIGEQTSSCCGVEQCHRCLLERSLHSCTVHTTSMVFC